MAEFHINSIPLFCAEPPPDFEIVCAYPILLNEATARGEFDVCLISRWEYLKVSDKYSVLPNYCIGGDGEIMSVKLFSKPTSQILAGKSIITEQPTSRARLRIYARENTALICLMADARAFAS
ncbi:MAG: MqnA/MqnD/SBP family protein [Bacilli bacterium]